MRSIVEVALAKRCEPRGRPLMLSTTLDEGCPGRIGIEIAYLEPSMRTLERSALPKPRWAGAQ